MGGCCVLLQIWVPPFHPLTATEVSYLVKGISEVYGVDEDMVFQQGGTAVTAAGVQVRGSRSHTVQLSAQEEGLLGPLLLVMGAS